MHVLISEFMDAPAVDALRQRFDVRYAPDLVDARDALLDAARQADGLIVRNRSQVDAALLAAAPRLRAVGRLGVGLDNIDLPGCAARGIQVVPATGANARAVAEYVIGTVLALLRGAYASSADVAAGRWPRTALSQGLEAHGRTLGVVGFGGIGQLTARLAAGLGMRIVACDAALPATHPVWAESGATPLPLDALLAQADAVSLHVPLNADTRHLLNADRIRGMRPGAILVNTSRGGIVDEAALAAALRMGHLRGAALDVFDQEPLPGGGPLADAPNLILTPHIAGLTQEANTRVSDMVAAGVTIALTGGAR
ncbi:(S)-sulfolactate dehydrogenase [Achromobacter deleyi]|uniref:(S)-sulfolactate dehydrogenase n=1 Tax=Achromobacter deleyi TaxID=1353891 RepID=A0A6S7A3U9_9BURK|nr:hydroxyacid dehydrogenase [Achromobacter deleyi]CAB3709437.1 (S)-sulfolactate dehydrogenase [Achromobacter deleyi]CAB3873779.1 (S)-sulfolactate dehydrogenase [Achromobacter deleyi]CAB3895306.1 (S)-sulfolactate dehydrogenase [Achromobacter deleyi]